MQNIQSKGNHEGNRCRPKINLSAFFAVFLLLIIFLLCISFKVSSQVKNQKIDGIVLHSFDCQGRWNAQRGIPEGGGRNRYHYLVKTDGTVHQGAPLDQALPHISGRFAPRSLSIMIEGSFKTGFFLDSIEDEGKISSQQREALVKLLLTLMDRYDIPLSQIERHMDHDEPVFCPGSGFPFFEILYETALKVIKSAGNKTLEEICKTHGLTLPLENAEIVVYKSQYQLELYEGDTLLKTYKIGLSRLPQGDKIKQGDLKTPEGSFFITEKYPMRAWMEISYPTEKHVKAGLEKKIITGAQYDSIMNQLKRGGIAPHHTGLGHDVGFHAGGFPYGRLRKDSTAGCIVLEDPEAFEFFKAVPLGSSVKIYP